MGVERRVEVRIQEARLHDSRLTAHSWRTNSRKRQRSREVGNQQASGGGGQVDRWTLDRWTGTRGRRGSGSLTSKQDRPLEAKEMEMERERERQMEMDETTRQKEALSSSDCRCRCQCPYPCQCQRQCQCHCPCRPSSARVDRCQVD